MSSFLVFIVYPSCQLIDPEISWQLLWIKGENTMSTVIIWHSTPLSPWSPRVVEEIPALGSRSSSENWGGVRSEDRGEDWRRRPDPSVFGVWPAEKKSAQYPLPLAFDWDITCQIPDSFREFKRKVFFESESRERQNSTDSCNNQDKKCHIWKIIAVCLFVRHKVVRSASSLQRAYNTSSCFIKSPT